MESAPALLATLAAAGILLVLAGRLHDGPEGDWVRRALLAGLLLRLGAAVAIESLGGFPDERGTYDPLARAAAADWAAGRDSALSWHPLAAGRWAYFYLLGGTYAALGDAPLVGRLLGAVLGLAAALLCGEVARGLGGRRAAALGVVVLALHPEHALWSATVARDTLSTVLVLATLAIAVRRDGELLRGGILAAAVPLALLAGNSFLPAAAAAAGLAAALLVEGAGGILRGAAAAAAVGLLPALVIRRWGPWLTPENVGRARSGELAGGGAWTAEFLPGLRLESVAGLLAYLPLGAAFVLLAPWPWDATHVRRAAYAPLAAVGAMVSLAGIAGLAASVRRARPGAVAAAAFAAALLAALALLEGQSGIVVRHRLPLTAVLCAGLAAAVPPGTTWRDLLPRRPSPAR